MEFEDVGSPVHSPQQQPHDPSENEVKAHKSYYEIASFIKERQLNTNQSNLLEELDFPAKWQTSIKVAKTFSDYCCRCKRLTKNIPFGVIDGAIITRLIQSLEATINSHAHHHAEDSNNNVMGTGNFHGVLDSHAA